ncbi:hypothetical protein [Butyrivibrio proteoclasticus]|uniref:hypothetical protein n=1 Tax=Butyrivibrio proteoclasticus TaxID=43305 RepID=UPI00047C5EA6|nr:hypothetical protein [Butyrivibrio proteoclasticus]
MKFSDYNMMENAYQYISGSKEYKTFDEVEQAISEFENSLLAIENITAEKVDSIHGQIYFLCGLFEKQGFIYGMANGMNIQKQADSLNIERK